MKTINFSKLLLLATILLGSLFLPGFISVRDKTWKWNIMLSTVEGFLEFTRLGQNVWPKWTGFPKIGTRVSKPEKKLVILLSSVRINPKELTYRFSELIGTVRRYRYVRVIISNNANEYDIGVAHTTCLKKRDGSHSTGLSKTSVMGVLRWRTLTFGTGTKSCLK